MNIKDIKVGQDITLVSKGIRHTYGAQTYIDELQAGNASFLRVTKVGKKYVYGVHFYFEEGQRKDFYYTSDCNLDEYVVFPGVRQDLIDQHRQFLRDHDEFEKLRENKRYELERELHDQLNAKMDAWDKTNLRPKNSWVT